MCNVDSHQFIIADSAALPSDCVVAWVDMELHFLHIAYGLLQLEGVRCCYLHVYIPTIDYNIIQNVFNSLPLLFESFFSHLQLQGEQQRWRPLSHGR